LDYVSHYQRPVPGLFESLRGPNPPAAAVLTTTGHPSPAAAANALELADIRTAALVPMTGFSRSTSEMVGGNKKRRRNNDHREECADDAACQ
jgi:hypothetical protein